MKPKQMWTVEHKGQRLVFDCAAIREAARSCLSSGSAAAKATLERTQNILNELQQACLQLRECVDGSFIAEVVIRSLEGEKFGDPISEKVEIGERLGVVYLVPFIGYNDHNSIKDEPKQGVFATSEPLGAY